MSVQLDSLRDEFLVGEPPVTDRRGACRAAVRAFRPRRVVPATLAAALVTLTGASATTLLVSERLSHPVVRPELIARAGRLTWGDPIVLGTGAGMVLAGLLFALAAALPGRTRTTALAGDDPRFMIGLSRSSLRAMLRAAVLDVPGVERARVRLRGRLRPKVFVRAAIGNHDPEVLWEQVTDAVRARLETLDPARPPEVVVRLAWREG